MTPRDRTVLIAVVSLALVAASWFLLLSPARKDAAALDAQVVTAQGRATAAEALVVQGEAAKAASRADYAAVSQLGKAVPADDDVPSLVVQLEGAAQRSKVDFGSIELASSAGAPAAAPAAPVAPPAPPNAAAPAAPTGATGPSVVPAPATQAVASVLPPGAVVGSAGFPTMPFDFAFTGSFFNLQALLARLDRFTQLEGDDIRVRGRLLTIDGFSLSESPKGFPNMVASVRATAYLLPPEASPTPGAPPAAAVAPAATPASTTTPGSGPTPPSAATASATP